VIRAVGPSIFDAAASLCRRLPHFRGKWQVVDVVRPLLLRLRGHEDDRCTVRMKDGSLMTWDVRDASEGRAAFLGLWDDEVREAVWQRLAPNAVILDVGANVGAWAVPLARRLGAGGRVYAFEPVPANRDRLERAVAQNALSNVTVSPFALGDAEATVDMWLRTSVTGASSGTAALVPTGAGHVTVTMRPMDAWVAQAALDRLDFMKLDVEGAELLVLAGAEQTVARFRPLILAEFDEYWMSTRGQSPADARQWAGEHRYRMMAWDRRQKRFVDTETTDGDATLLLPEERA
jgi:FkbM family methyltransferase